MCRSSAFDGKQDQANSLACRRKLARETAQATAIPSDFHLLCSLINSLLSAFFPLFGRCQNRIVVRKNRGWKRKSSGDISSPGRPSIAKPQHPSPHTAQNNIPTIMRRFCKRRAGFLLCNFPGIVAVLRLALITATAHGQNECHRSASPKPFK